MTDGSLEEVIDGNEEGGEGLTGAGGRGKWVASRGEGATPPKSSFVANVSELMPLPVDLQCRTCMLLENVATQENLLPLRLKLDPRPPAFDSVAEASLLDESGDESDAG